MEIQQGQRIFPHLYMVKIAQSNLSDVFQNLPPHLQSKLRNVLDLAEKQKYRPYNPSEEEKEYYYNLGVNALGQLNELQSAELDPELQGGLHQITNEISQYLNQSLQELGPVATPVSEPEPETPVETVVRPRQEKFVMPKAEQTKKRRLTSKYLEQDVKTQREKEIEAESLGLTLEEFEKVDQPSEEIARIKADVKFPNKDEVDVDDLIDAVDELQKRENEVPEELKEDYGILYSAVNLIANAIDEQKAELAFREFEAVFGEVANGLEQKAPQLFAELNDDIYKILGTIYVATYKTADDFNVDYEQSVGADDLTVKQDPGSVERYSYRQKVQNYWKERQKGATYKRMYDPNTKSFTTEFVGYNPEKRQEVLNKGRKNFKNYMLRLSDVGRAKYNKSKNTEQSKILRMKRNQIRGYLRALRDIVTRQPDQREALLNKLNEKQVSDSNKIQSVLNSLKGDLKDDTEAKLKTLDDKFKEDSSKILRASRSVGILKLARRFSALVKSALAKRV